MPCDIYIFPIGESWVAAICKDNMRVVVSGGFDSPDLAIEQAKYDLPACGCTNHNKPIYVQDISEVPE